MTHATRRDFLKDSALIAGGAALAAGGGTLLTSGGRQARADEKPAEQKKPLYKISCTEYSLHRMIAKGDLDNLDYAPFIKKEFDIDAVEYWNRPFMQKAEDLKYITDMKKRADDAGVTGTCILIDGEGDLGAPEEANRQDAIKRHKKWVAAAKMLGCYSIRVNARSQGSYEEQKKLAADGLRGLCEVAKPFGISVIVENHGGLSSNGKWLAEVMQAVDMENVGTLPDFGNFHGYDRYKGVEETMPYAKLVSAKSHDFDKDGNETKTDYMRMMKIVVDAGYHGYVGIEYEGRTTPEIEGIKLTKALLERVRDHLAS